VATLVLSTRYRPRPVLVGVAAAFAVQCAIAATAGSVITLLPRRAVEAVVAALFAIGAVLLIRESLAPDDDDVELAEHRESRSFWRIVLTSFGVLFAAEWGDASQIATAGLVARKDGLPHAVATGVARSSRWSRWPRWRPSSARCWCAAFRCTWCIGWP